MLVKSAPTDLRPPASAFHEEQAGHEHRWIGYLALPIALLLLAWWLRLATIAPYELGTDGGLATGLAAGPLHTLFFFNARDVHPPLYYLLLRWWMAGGGLGWTSLKWLGAAGGMLTAAALFRWVRTVAGDRAAVVALLAIVLAPSVVIAGASVRDFAVGLAASTLSVLFFWRCRQQPVTRASQAALALITGAAGWLWYFHLPVFAVEILWAVCWRSARRALLPLLFGAALWIPWAFLAGPPLIQKLQMGINSLGTGTHSAGQPFSQVMAVAGGWYPGPIPTLLTAAVTLGLAGIGLSSIARKQPQLTLFLASAIVATGLMLWFVNGHWSPQAGIDRYGLAVVPFVAASGALIAQRGERAALTVAALWVLITVPNLVRMPHYTGRFAYSPDPGLNLLLDHWQRGDCVAFESIDRLGYFAVRGGDVSDAVAFEDNGSSFERLGAPERIQRELPVLEAHCRRLWYVQDGQKPGHLLEQALTRSATLKRQWHTASGLVQLYIPVHPPSLAGLSTL